MKNETTKELKLKVKNPTDNYEPTILEVSVSYSKGGANYFQGTQERRGYWLHVTPVRIGDGFRSMTMGGGKGGLKSFLKEVVRQAPKALARAEQIAQARERRVVLEVLARLGMELEDASQLPAEMPELPAEVLMIEAPTLPPVDTSTLPRAMRMTQEELKRIPAIGTQAENPDPMVQVKFFQPWGGWTWYAYESDGVDECFGYVVGLENEIGYFSLKELGALRGPGGLTIERDIHWKPTPLSVVKAKYEGARV